MSRKLTLKLSNLYLDLKNPRYEEQRSQNEALNTIAGEQKGKLLVLLKDILENGVNPSDIPIVMQDKSKANGYIVLEGNRRIAALKLFKKPGILTGVSLKQKYAKLHDEYKGKTVNSIECLIVDTREEANLWIERKHEGEMNGAGTVRWDNVQKNRFLTIKTGKDTKVVQLIDFLKAAMVGDFEFVAQLGKVKPTNLERLLSTPEVCSDLGLTYVRGEYISHYEWTEVLKGLKSIVSLLSRDDFKVGLIYQKKDRINFIKKIPQEMLPDKNKMAEVPWKLKDFKPILQRVDIKGQSNEGTDTAGNVDADKQNEEQPQKERPTSRNTFLPDTLSLSIPNDRINRIYSELKLLSHIRQPNTCGVMMRVFLELSVDYALEQFSMLKNEALSGSDDARDLRQKTNAVIQRLESDKYLGNAKAKGIKTEINKKQSVFSVDTMNAYVHNGDFNPIPKDVMLSWDNIQPFMIALWKAINEKEK